MAYVQTPSPTRRLAALGGVALLHVAAVYALLSGFAVTMYESLDDRLRARQIPAEPPPPPAPEASADPREPPLLAPKPLIDLNRSPREATIIDLLPVEPRPLPTLPARDPLPLPQPSASASYAAKAAIPLGNPGKWATSDDYPARALREEREGTTRFRVTIGPDGRVRNCEVTASSGSSDLDKATCESVAKRARFRPATDDTGASVTGSYANAVRWEIPD